MTLSEHYDFIIKNWSLNVKRVTDKSSFVWGEENAAFPY